MGKKSHTPRSLCKSLKQMHQIARSMHYQADLLMKITDFFMIFITSATE